MKGNKGSFDLKQTVDLLNQILKMEYSLIIHYPRLANRIKDKEMKKLVQELGIASISHADTVANIIMKLGGNAIWSFEQLPEEDSLVKIFQLQLEKEKTALQLHQQAAKLVIDSQMRAQLSGLAEEERSHIKVADGIIAGLEA